MKSKSLTSFPLMKTSRPDKRKVEVSTHLFFELSSSDGRVLPPPLLQPPSLLRGFLPC